MNKKNHYMQVAFELAKKGGRLVAPNPMVGAVIVKDGVIVGEGYHKIFGGAHAEVEAINSVSDKSTLAGASIHVTLEPCRHEGKTPPCQNLIESVGISHVFYGSKDPFQTVTNPNIQGAVSSSYITSHVTELADLNKFFFTWVTEKRPYITVKIATSADGFVAGIDGQTVHFTSADQDKYVHQLRANHQAIMVGSNTVLKDNPSLNVRHLEGVDPFRIILDSKNRIPKTAKVFVDDNYLHITTRTPFNQLFEGLAKQGISSVLVEPGPTLYNVLKEEGLIDELIVLKGEEELKNGLSIQLD